jgi:hypothetical protein
MEAAMTAEPPLQVENREELVYLLGKACELEHGLMCEYLYAQFSLKRTAAEGLTPEQLERVQAWESALIGVIKQEMCTDEVGRAAACSRPAPSSMLGITGIRSSATPTCRRVAPPPCPRHSCCRYPAGRRAGAPAGKAVHSAGIERDADRHRLRRAQPVPSSPDVQHRAAGRRQPALEGLPRASATRTLTWNAQRTVIPAVN